MKSTIQKISKYTFYTGIVAAVYGLCKTFIDRRGLSPEACPIESNRPIMYVAIALLVTSLILDFIEDFQNKR